MVTYEDTTGFFLKAAAGLDLMTHPEFWLNTHSLEREFACTCHTGSCDEVEQQCSCTLSFTWGALDTSLSMDGPVGICEFFHDESEPACPHLHTHAIPPLVLDLSYGLALNGMVVSEDTLLALTQTLKLRASENSQRTIETRPGVSMVLQDGHLRPETLSLQQRVEVPIWHPLGMHGLHDDPRQPVRRSAEDSESSADEPHPEEWLPQIMIEICQDILQVLAALEAVVAYHSSDKQ